LPKAIVTADLNVEKAANHFRSLNALISPMYKRHAKYVAIVAARRKLWHQARGRR